MLGDVVLYGKEANYAIVSELVFDRDISRVVTLIFENGLKLFPAYALLGVIQLVCAVNKLVDSVYLGKTVLLDIHNGLRAVKKFKVGRKLVAAFDFGLQHLILFQSFVRKVFWLLDGSPLLQGWKHFVWICGHKPLAIMKGLVAVYGIVVEEQHIDVPKAHILYHRRDSLALWSPVYGLEHEEIFNTKLLQFFYGLVLIIL